MGAAVSLIKCTARPSRSSSVMSAVMGSKTSARPCQALLGVPRASITPKPAPCRRSCNCQTIPPRTTSVFERQAKHGPLLVGVTATALNAKRRLCARQELFGFALDTGREGRIRRIVEIRKSKILPDQTSVFIRQCIEGIGLIDHRAAHSQEVHAGVTSGLEKRLRLFTRTAERYEIRVRPACAARKNRYAVSIS